MPQENRTRDSLHPNMLTSLMRLLHAVLEDFHRFAILATHSPQVLQELPARSIRIIERDAEEEEHDEERQSIARQELDKDAREGCRHWLEVPRRGAQGGHFQFVVLRERPEADHQACAVRRDCTDRWSQAMCGPA
jgi:hypothetical protein